MEYMTQENNTNGYSVGKKIYLLRKHNNVSQELLCSIMRVRQERIKQVEREEAEYTQAHIDAAKECFGIVGLPLTEWECITFRERLYYWRDLIDARKMDEARAIYKEVANIHKLELCDIDIVILCKLMMIRFLITDKKYEEAEKEIKLCEKYVDQMKDEQLYYYYINDGFLNFRKEQYEKSLEIYLKAYELIDNDNPLLRADRRLYVNIAWCYAYIELPYLAIFFYNKAKYIHSDNISKNLSLYIEYMSAFCYVTTNQLKEAEKILNKCLAKIEGTRNDSNISMVLLHFGHLHKKKEEWITAIDFYDKAILYINNTGVDSYFVCHYHKIYCIIQTKKFTKAKQMLEQIKKECINNELWKQYFTSLEHYLKISSHMTSYDYNDCIEYILSKAIPYFFKNHDYLLAKDYYQLLEKHYEKVGSTKKSLQMTKAIYSISQRCFIKHGGSVNI